MIKRSSKRLGALRCDVDRRVTLHKRARQWLKRSGESQKLNFLCVLLRMVLLASVGCITACSQPRIATATVPAVECVYRLMRANPAIQSVDVYAVDRFRSAIEYNFRDKYGDLTADLVLTGWKPGISTFYMSGPKSARSSSREGAFISNLKLQRCPLNPAFDDLEPPPKPRNEWKRVSWPH